MLQLTGRSVFTHVKQDQELKIFLFLKTVIMKYVNSNGVFLTEEVKPFSGRKILDLSFSLTHLSVCVCTCTHRGHVSS